MRTLALFRPESKMEETARLGEALGYRVLRVPAVTVEEVPDGPWQAFVAGLGKERWTWIIFTSTIGVEIALRRLQGRGLLPSLGRGHIIAIGDATRLALERGGVPGAQVPPKTSSKGIVALLSNHDLVGGSVAVLRSDRGSPVLVEALEDLGAEVLEVPLYRLGEAPGSEALEQFLAHPGQVDLFVFGSALTVTNLMEAARASGRLAPLEAALARGKVFALGDPTAEALATWAVRVDGLPRRSHFEELLMEIRARYPP